MANEVKIIGGLTTSSTKVIASILGSSVGGLRSMEKHVSWTQNPNIKSWLTVLVQTLTAEVRGNYLTVWGTVLGRSTLMVYT